MEFIKGMDISMLPELDLALASMQRSPSIWARGITEKRIRQPRRDLCLP